MPLLETGSAEFDAEVAEVFIGLLPFTMPDGKGSGAAYRAGDDATFSPLNGSASGRSPFRPPEGLRQRLE